MKEKNKSAEDILGELVESIQSGIKQTENFSQPWSKRYGNHISLVFPAPIYSEEENMSWSARILIDDCYSIGYSITKNLKRELLGNIKEELCLGLINEVLKFGLEFGYLRGLEYKNNQAPNDTNLTINP